MSHVRIFAALAVSVICVGCTVTRERAERVATRALSDRNLPLPANHTVTVSEGHAAIYAGGGSDLWYVYFSAPGRIKPLYTVVLDQRFGTVSTVKDSRSSSSHP
jgi:hypothetical protein